MCLCIWTQCVLTHSVLTHCVRTQCGAQKCLAYKKKLAKSTFAICSLCCKVLQLYGSLCSLWGGGKSLLFFSPFSRTFYMLSFFLYDTPKCNLCQYCKGMAVTWRYLTAFVVRWKRSCRSLLQIYPTVSSFFKRYIVCFVLNCWLHI